MNINIKKLITQLFSWTAVGLILYLLISSFITNLGELESIELYRFRPMVALASLIGFTAVITWWGIVWWVILPKNDRKKISFVQVLYLQSVSWLARYVPGKAGSILGKIILGKKYDIRRRTLIIAGGYEQLLQVASAFLVGFGFVGWAWVQETGQSAVAVLALGVILGIFIFLHPKVFYPVANKALTIAKREPLVDGSLLRFRELIGITCMYALGHIANGFAFFLMVKSISPVMNSSVIIFVGSFVLAGVIGVVSLFAPSGLGVREGVMTGLLVLFFPMEEALLYSLMSRIFTTLADLPVLLYWSGFELYKRKLVSVFEWGVYVVGFVFLVIIPLVFTGSYIDEYWHIFAGRGFVEEWRFPEIYEGAAYVRGGYLSAIMGFLQRWFGESLYLLKMLPIVLSVGTWYFLREISREVFEDKAVWTRIMLFGLWLLSPWLFVNHVYIRNYIFYELILVFLVWWGMNLHVKHRIRWYIEALVVGIFLGVFVYLDQQPTSYLLAIPYLIFLDVGYFTRGDLLRNLKLQRVIVIVFWILVGIAGLSIGIVEDFLTRDFVFATDKNYLEFFLIDQWILTGLAVFGVLTFFLRKQIKYVSIALVFVVLIGLHMISSEDVQLIRNIFYILPVYYLFTVGVVYDISTRVQKRFRVAIITGGGILLVVGYIQAFPLDHGYFMGPYIPGEINYIDYQKAYVFVEENCSDRVVYETSPTPFISEFYDVEVIPVVTNMEKLQEDTIFTQSEGEYRVNLTDQSVVTSMDEFEEEYCWVRRIPSLGNYLVDTAYQGEVTKFVGIEVIKR